MSSPTLKDVYEVVNRLEDKMDKRLTCIEKDIEERLSEIEEWKNNITGKISIIAAMAGSVMGIIVSIITAYITKRL